jgi:hypothetical protein
MVKLDEMSEEMAVAIRMAAEKRAEAKRLEEEAKVLKKDADELLMPLLKSLEEPKAVIEGLGTVTVVSTTRSKFDQAVAKEALVMRGVASDIVAMSFTEATTYTESEYVLFTQEKVRTA